MSTGTTCTTAAAIKAAEALPAGVGSTSRIGHAEIELASGTLYLADECPDIGVTAPGQARRP